MSYKDMVPLVHPFPGEQHSCITLTEWVTSGSRTCRSDDVHVTYAGGGSGGARGKAEYSSNEP